MFLIRTEKPVLAQSHSQNECNHTLRRGLPKEIRNSVGAGKIYSTSRGNPSPAVRSFSKGMSSWEHNVLQTLVSVLCSGRGIHEEMRFGENAYVAVKWQNDTQEPHLIYPGHRLMMRVSHISGGSLSSFLFWSSLFFLSLSQKLHPGHESLIETVSSSEHFSF